MDSRQKIQSLEKKIAGEVLHLSQETHQKLTQQRVEQLAAFLCKMNLHFINEATIIGALLWDHEKITHNDPLKEVWRETGEKFLRKKRFFHSQPEFQTVASSEKDKSAFKSFKTSSEPGEDTHEM